MEVTVKNFRDILPKVAADVKAATFISVEGLYTGESPRYDASVHESPSEHYSRLRTLFSSFLLLQFGLSTFRYDSDKNTFFYNTYSFYVFPRSCPFGKGLFSYKFVGHSASIDRLSKNNFDFNKLFKEGIPFLNVHQQNRARKSLADKVQRATSNNTNEALENLTIPESMKDMIQNFSDQVTNMLKDDNIQNVSMFLPDQNVRRKTTLYMKLKFGYENLTYFSKNWHLRITRRRKDPNYLSEQHQQDKLEEFIGFFRVFEILYKSGKPIVGYNLFTNLCNFIIKFWNYLPNEYYKFKLMVHQLLPRLIDTKYIALTPIFNNYLQRKGLIENYYAAKLPPFSPSKFEPETEECRFKDNELHPSNAGFGSYMIGVIYQSMANYLGSFQVPPISPVLPDHSLLEKYSNKIYIQGDHVYSNLAGQDPAVDRSYFFYVKHPDHWRINEINSLFAPYGGVFYKRMSNSLSFVTLHNKSKAVDVMEHFITAPPQRNLYGEWPTFKIIPYGELALTPNQKGVSYYQLNNKRGSDWHVHTPIRQDWGQRVKIPLRRRNTYRDTKTY